MTRIQLFAKIFYLLMRSLTRFAVYLKGKNPCADGLPLEFYVKFWDQLSPILLQLYNYSFDHGSLSPSMQESITRLIFKKDDPKNLKNWRPISLLNVDYKILSKALTNRLLRSYPPSSEKIRAALSLVEQYLIIWLCRETLFFFFFFFLYFNNIY